LYNIERVKGIYGEREIHNAILHYVDQLQSGSPWNEVKAAYIRDHGPEMDYTPLFKLLFEE
jgi:hypothetical protein